VTYSLGEAPEENLGTHNILTSLFKEIDTGNLETERDEVNELLSCFKRQPEGELKYLSLCLNSVADKYGRDATLSLNKAAAAADDSSVPILSNPRVLMLVNVESDLERYMNNPGMTTCTAAFDAAQSVEQMDVLAHRHVY